MSWLIYVLISINLFAFVNLFDKYFCSKRFKNIYAFAVAINILYLPFILITTFILRKTFIFDQSFFFAVLSGLTYFFMWIFWWKALISGEVSRITAIFAIQPIFNAVFAALLLGETLSFSKWLAVFLIVTGAVLSSLEKKGSKGLNRAYLYALIAAVVSALANVISKYSMMKMPALTVNSIGFFTGFPLFLLFLRNQGIKKEVKRNFFKLKTLLPLFLRGALGFGAICFFMLAIGSGPVSLVVAVSGAGPLTVFIYSTLVSLFWPKIIKEDLSKKVLLLKSIAIVLVVIGVVLISL